ncbi:MAG: glycosyl hydrolase [Polyangiaceae bacterium]|nr:glycosyl hydrolase [Polyangiaceae bacterium]
MRERTRTGKGFDLRRSRARRGAAAGLALGALAAAGAASAEVPVQRTRFQLPASNGFGAALLDLSQARLTHFREHLFATEEPQLDGAGNEVWIGNQPQAVKTRDLLYDAYFGLRSGGTQRWLTSIPVDLDASGYAPYAGGAIAGTGVAAMVQRVGGLELTQLFFAPQALERAALVMAMRVRNTGAATESGVSAFSLHNFHLGYGRPGVMGDSSGQHTGEGGETVLAALNGAPEMIERAFAGAVVARAIGPVSRRSASNSGTPAAQNIYFIVNGGGSADLPDQSGDLGVGSGWITGFQWDFGALDPGDQRWVGVAFAHHGDPFGASAVQAELASYVGGKGAQQIVDEEIAAWASFQGAIDVPASATPEDATLVRQSAVMLKMAQSRERHAYLRDVLTDDATPRWTRFGATLGGPPAQLPATVEHRGQGAVLASLPPGEWTYAWIRDGAYATVAMAALGMDAEARAALDYYIHAESGRFRDWSELASYSMPEYQVSLVRYHGFGVEETDFNEFGPNLEFDGFGLFLWALRQYEQLTGDTGFVDESWGVATAKVADALVALVDPATGLIRKDSSIWETHWNGRERSWAYTSITAARGLCDAADIAERRGEMERAAAYRDAGIKLRAAIAEELTDPDGAIASNLEELAAGEGYWDAAVIDAVAMGLFDPHGAIAQATMAGLDAHLVTPAGAGWSRNDDRYDHGGAADLSPWGSEYDSAEWVVTDLRGAVAARWMGDTDRSERLMKWVRDQSLANYLAVAETYDEHAGTYKFNAPMVGFGAGAFALAVAARDGVLSGPACGVYHEGTTGAGGGGGAGGHGAGGSGAGAGAGGVDRPEGGDVDEGCGCRAAGSDDTSLAAWAALALGALAAAAARRRRG